MELVKLKNGIRYKVKVYLQNGKAKTKTCRTKTEANQWKQDLESLKRRSPESLSRSKSVQTFISFFQEWMDLKIRQKRSEKTQSQYDSFGKKHFEKFFKGMRLQTISENDIERFVSYLVGLGLRPKSANNVLSLVKQVFKYAVEEDILPKSPARRISFLKVPQINFAYLQTEEIKTLLDQNKFEPIYPILVTALNTGMRKGEILGLCWDCINLDSNQILVKRSLSRTGLNEHNKTKKIYHIPINAPLRRLFLELLSKQKSQTYVFCNEKGLPHKTDHFCDRE
ncbi:MAG: phage integrase SAM-like domain-containing protein, partial [Sediminibacterium sp.]|nr:phage integrase SAM-like domain-containing protein [Sediminibacterium sp.]